MTIRFEPLDAIEGALVRPVGTSSWVILLNQNIDHDGRLRFTLAHEIGHFLLHRHLGSDRKCSVDDVDGFSTSVNPLETEANEFASQLLLPPDIVRSYTEAGPFDIGRLRELSKATGTSLTAAALAYIAVSSRPVGFAVVRDGFVLWGRASDTAFRRGVRFWSGREAPEQSFGSAELLTNTEIEAHAVTGWFYEHNCTESGYYSKRLGKMILCLDFEGL